MPLKKKAARVVSDDEAPIEDLLFVKAPYSKRLARNSSFSSKDVARDLRNGVTSERDAIPSNDFIKQAKRRRKAKTTTIPAREALFDKIDDTGFQGKWILDDEEESKQAPKKDLEDKLSKRQLVEMLQEDAEEVEGFIVNDNEIEVEEDASEDEEEASGASSEEEGENDVSDDDECSWEEEENGDDSEDLYDDSDEECSIYETELLKPWSVLNFDLDSVKETFFDTTTKEKFSWSPERKKAIYWLMSQSMKYPVEKGFTVYSTLRKKKHERVGKDTMQSDFEELKILCRYLERDVAAVKAKETRLKRSDRRSNGVKEARKRKRKGPKKATDITVSMETIVHEVVKIQLADFQREKEDRNIKTHLRPYHDGPNMKAAKNLSQHVEADSVDIHSNITAINAYFNYLSKLLQALFPDNEEFVAQLQQAKSYKFAPIGNGESDYTLQLFKDTNTSEASVAKVIDGEDENIAFYRALLNFTFLPLTAKMLVVSVSTNKGRKMCEAASSTSQLDLDIISWANVGDLVKRIISQSQELHTIAFPDDPEGHYRLPLRTVHIVEDVEEEDTK